MTDNTSDIDLGKTRCAPPLAEQADRRKPTLLQCVCYATLRTLAMLAEEYSKAPPPVTEAPIFIAPTNGFISGKQAEETRERLRLARGSLEIVLHSRGGDSGAIFEIVYALKNYKGGEVRAYIPRIAYSGATMIALAADRMYMGKGAVLGPVDPQFGGYAASDIISLVNSKRPGELDIETRLLAIRAEKAFAETRALAATMVETPEALERLTSGLVSHNIPIPFAEASTLRLPVEEGVPDRLFNLLDAHLRASKFAAQWQLELGEMGWGP